MSILLEALLRVWPAMLASHVRMKTSNRYEPKPGTSTTSAAVVMPSTEEYRRVQKNASSSTEELTACFPTLAFIILCGDWFFARAVEDVGSS